jgi:hypothetical protein
MEDDEVIKSLPFKLKKSVRRNFKQTARSNGSNMQAVLNAFVESYIDDPKKFRIKMEVVVDGS